MLVLGRKIYSRNQDDEWRLNTIAEQERNKERDRKFKKLSLHDKIAADAMWQDTDTAGKERMNRNQAVSGLVGAAAGVLAGHLGNKALKADHGHLARIGGGILGNIAAKGITYKKNRRIAESIWDKGDKEQMDYINADKETKKEIEKNYKPIGWRVNRKGEYLKKEDEFPYSGIPLSDRIKVRESYVNDMNKKDSKKKSKKKRNK